ncbi:MAG: hypothetical protein ACOYNB_04320 [Aquabacterium sp.]|uniref:hypothetical protein n=1 Tax=Aquabacterium sp. TaxID=1872578 RepID=UPI003BDFF31F
MIDAHRRVFSSMDIFCAERNDPVKNAGADRWTATSKGLDKERLLFAKLQSSLSFADTLKIARFDHDEKSLFFTVGLELPDEIDFLQEEDLSGGALTLILSELSPRPVKSTSEIRNIVEAEDKNSTTGYKGHSYASIASLFPEIRCFSTKKLAEDETNRVFFLLCLSATARGMLWMNSRLRETLTLIAELSPVAIPYRTLCRSVFDTDPSALFMALYRCLEALYAYSHTTSLINRLGIDEPWSNVAQILEETLSWRPREEQSLGTLLRHAVPNDLRAILSAMGEGDLEDGDIVNRATKRIYNLRNSLVHYRPFHQSFHPESVDWNVLCEATALLVLHVYHSTITSK